MKLEADRGGDGARLFVLLHGLGATREVWAPLAPLVQGRWIAPDLRGHGASPHAKNYGLGLHAADVAELVDADDVVVIGHSMGGAVALALASGWFGFMPRAVFALGIKVAWSQDDLAGMRKLAASAPKVFPTKDEAIARYLKVSGLHGLVTTDASGVAETDGGWRLAYDPATASIGPPPMIELTHAAAAPIHLARGESDPMVRLGELADHCTDACNLPGGHNAMVENPAAVWDWIASRLG